MPVRSFVIFLLVVHVDVDGAVRIKRRIKDAANRMRKRVSEETSQVVGEEDLILNFTNTSGDRLFTTSSEEHVARQSVGEETSKAFGNISIMRAVVANATLHAEAIEAGATSEIYGQKNFTKLRSQDQLSKDAKKERAEVAEGKVIETFGSGHDRLHTIQAQLEPTPAYRTEELGAAFGTYAKARLKAPKAHVISDAVILQDLVDVLTLAKNGLQQKLKKKGTDGRKGKAEWSAPPTLYDNDLDMFDRFISLFGITTKDIDVVAPGSKLPAVAGFESAFAATWIGTVHWSDYLTTLGKKDLLVSFGNPKNQHQAARLYARTLDAIEYVHLPEHPIWVAYKTSETASEIRLFEKKDGEEKPGKGKDIIGEYICEPTDGQNYIARNCTAHTTKLNGEDGEHCQCNEHYVDVGAAGAPVTVRQKHSEVVALTKYFKLPVFIPPASDPSSDFKGIRILNLKDPCRSLCFPSLLTIMGEVMQEVPDTESERGPRLRVDYERQGPTGSSKVFPDYKDRATLYLRR